MKTAVIPVRKAAISDRAALINIWESSVRATHHFLGESDIAFFREQILTHYFDIVDLFLITSQEDEIAGFLGLSPGKIEMLFVDPVYFRKGFGGILVDYAISAHSVTRVDVNEANPDAIQFYLHKGFKVINRLEKDAEGKEFSILELELEKN